MRPSDAAAALIRRKECREDFGKWCEMVLAENGQAPAAHHRLMIRELQAIEDGTNDRLLICLPPGSAKSTFASKLFPAHFMARHPGSLVIGASHSQSLADTFSGDVQRYVRSFAPELGYSLANEAVDLWRTTNGSTYRAVGVGGSVTGRRSNICIIDDPLKGAAEADSATIRDKAWLWYRNDLYTRLLPGGRIVCVTTRWNALDVAGHLLAEMKDGGDQWRVLSLPAIAEEHDELGRKPGEALWPEWEGLEALARKRKVLGERSFAALFQQRPTVQEGEILKREWWKPYETMPVPRPEMVVLSIDTAYTEKESNDASACTVWHLQADPPHRSKLLMRYAWRERLELNPLVKHIQATVRNKSFCPLGVPVLVLIEAKASGLSVRQELRRLMPELSITAVTPQGDKRARAWAVTSLFEGGKVATMSADGEFRPWAQMVIDECAAFPNGSHDDLCDSVSQGLRFFRDGGLEFFAEDAPSEQSFRPPRRLY